MWHSITVERKKLNARTTEKFAARTTKEGNNYKIWMTDLIHIWVESVSSEDLVKRCMELNSHIEAKPEKLIAKSLKLMDGTDTKFSLTSTGQETITLTVLSKLSNFIFCSKFFMHLDREEMINQEIVTPLLLLVQDLQAKQTILINQIKRKDIEINEYKLEGVQLARGNLTKPFDEKEFFQASQDQSMKGSPSVMEIFVKSAEMFPNMKQKCLLNMSDDSSADVSQQSVSPVKEEAQESVPESDELKSEPVYADPAEARDRYLALEREKKEAKRQKLSQKKSVLRL